MACRAEEVPKVVDNLRRIFQAINEYSKNAERMTGLTGPQLWAMKLLANSAPLRISELARLMYLRPATVVGIIDRLENKGLVSRTRSHTDRRAVDVVLTEAGQTIVAQSPEVAQVVLVHELESLSDEEFNRVADTMSLLASILGTSHITPQPLHST